MESKILDLAKKINELAKRGEDGERENAIAKLETLMNKYQITLVDIEEEIRTVRKFTISAAREKSLLLQIAVSVNDNLTYVQRKYSLYFNLTPSEFIEMDFKWETYRAAFEKEYAVFYSAFINKNNIFNPKCKSKDWDELTSEEKEFYRRVQGMAQNITRTNINKQLN